MNIDPNSSGWSKRTWEDRLSVRMLRLLYEYQSGRFTGYEMLHFLEDVVKTAHLERSASIVSEKP